LVLSEAGSESSTPFHHDISYFDMEGTMCVLWLPLQATGKNEGVVWVKGSHLWNKLFLLLISRKSLSLPILFDCPPARIAPSILCSLMKQIINVKENTIKFK